MFFLPHYTGQLFSVREGGLNKHHLMNLEKLEVWQTLYGTETRNGIAVSWDNAIDDVIRKIQDAGPFDVSDLRGRGVWLENGEIIISTGKKIIKEKEEYELKNYKSNHIYERLKEKKMEFSDPAKDDESKKIINCIEKLSFEKKISALYLAGWCVLAPFCGALDWRPHVWITGSSGSGKTTILKYIITPMLGDFSVYTSGLSSGAGIRQKMKNDSFSIVLDEAEPGSYQTGKINEILDLARMSSSEFRGSQVYKGTQAGNGISYKMRSMFCLSSVNTSLNKQADESRFSLISLDQNYKYPWTQLESEIFQTFSDEACKRVRARTMKNISVIRKNAKTFSFAAGSVLGKQRAGDQIGALVAGAMSLYEIKEYKLEEAKKIIKKYNIEINDEDNFSDEMQCFLKIFQSKIIYISEKGKNETTNLMNLVNMANTIPDGSNSNMINVATEELLKYGIRTKDNRVYLASNYAWIKDILQGSEWEHNYSKILRRLSFVDKELSCIRFGNYHRGNAVGIEKSNFEYFSQDKIFEEAGF
jgi:putative DNA primase/helicase